MHRVTPDLVSTLLAVAGLVAVVVAVALSPAAAWVAVLTGAVEALAVAWVVARNAQAAASVRREVGPDLRSVA